MQEAMAAHLKVLREQGLPVPTARTTHGYLAA